MSDSAGPASRRFISSRLRLHYADWGNREAPPLLLVHGGRDHCRSWDWVAAELRRDYHVIAPDLRGHGDSEWSSDGNYSAAAYVFDLAQLIHQQELAPVTIVAHSLGGMISLRYAGIYPENVKKIVAIEGLGPSPSLMAEQLAKPVAGRIRNWIEEQRGLAGRQPRCYASIAEALERMRSENPHLSAEVAQHLTEHGVHQNEDSSYSWKFDNYLRTWLPYGMTPEEVQQLWAAIDCPTLLVYGSESWASNPAQDGRAKHFRNAEVVSFEGAGHWVHHDRFEPFMAKLRDFLA